MVRTLTGLALADFRDRVRRPAYVVTLGAAVILGYLAVPSPDAQWMIMQLGDHRGVYNSAYVGMVTALASGLWITLGGFYVVRNSIERDRSTRVGQLLAATPVRTSAYLAGKFLSNLMLLSSMLGVLALTALARQIALGESSRVDPVALWQPFLLIALPLVAVTSALALLFETLPLLRGGLGNVVWFGCWLVLATAGQGPGLPLDGIGVNSVVRAMHDDMVAQGIDASGEFSLGLTYLDEPLTLFTWEGFTPTGGYVLGRVTLVLIALGVAVLPALWFGRFDPARVLPFGQLKLGSAPREASADSGAGDATGGMAGRGMAGGGAGGVAPDVFDAAPAAGGTSRPVVSALPRTRPEPGTVLPRVWAGELRILVQGVRWWWWLGAATILLAGLSAPLDGVSRVMLPLAWIWPLLIWSRLGSQRHESGVEGMLGAYPAVRRRVVAEWAAGFTLTALVGAGPLVRLVTAAEWTGVAAWFGGAVFIPSLALALGTLGRTHRLFQAVYLPLWYTVANGLPVFDYMGALGSQSEHASAQPLLTLAVALALLAVVFATSVLRRFGRD